MKQWKPVEMEIQRFTVTDVLTVSGEPTAPTQSTEFEFTFEDED